MVGTWLDNLIGGFSAGPLKVGLPASQQIAGAPAPTPAPAVDATPAGYGAGAAVGSAIGAALKPSPALSLLAPTPQAGEGLRTIANFGRGMVGLAPSVPPPAPLPPAVGGPAMGNVAAPATAKAVPQDMAPAGATPPATVRATPAPAAAPLTARQVTEQILANPQLGLHARAALMGGLPRQLTPQEAAGQKTMDLYDKVLQNELEQADKLPDAAAQAQAHSSAYQRYIQLLRPIMNPGYGMVGFSQEDKDGLPF
jgi:hypothetical protein